MENRDYLYKILLIGDYNVGKSSLAIQFTEGQFREEYLSTIGVDFRTKLIQLDDKTIKLQLWETSGGERFRSIAACYYRGADGVILVYDVSNKDSFDHVQSWFHELERHSPENASRLLIGNKCDLEAQRKVEFSEGQNLAEQLGIQFIETSAKDTISVERAFITVAADIKSRFATGSLRSPRQESLKLGQTTGVENNPDSSWSCC